MIEPWLILLVEIVCLKFLHYSYLYMHVVPIFLFNFFTVQDIIFRMYLWYFRRVQTQHVICMAINRRVEVCTELLTAFAKCPTAACEHTGYEDVVMRNKNKAIKWLNNDFYCHTCCNWLKLCSFFKKHFHVMHIK